MKENESRGEPQGAVEGARTNGKAHARPVDVPQAAAATSRDEEGGDPEQGELALAPFVLEFLQSERGHQLANRGFDLLDSFKKATLDEQAKSRALEGEIEKLNLRQTWLLKTLGLVIVVGAIIGLSATNTLRPEAATILGAVAGYLFAQQAKASA